MAPKANISPEAFKEGTIWLCHRLPKHQEFAAEGIPVESSPIASDIVH